MQIKWILTYNMNQRPWLVKRATIVYIEVGGLSIPEIKMRNIQVLCCQSLLLQNMSLKYYETELQRDKEVKV